MPCHRCHNLMFPADLLDEAGGVLNQPSTAWRCFACGEVIDPLICSNRDLCRQSEGAEHKKGARH